MFVKIINISEKDSWYSDCLGSIFYVYEVKSQPDMYVLLSRFTQDSKFLFFNKSDCLVLNYDA